MMMMILIIFIIIICLKPLKLFVVCCYFQTERLKESFHSTDSNDSS